MGGCLPGMAPGGLQQALEQGPLRFRRSVGPAQRLGSLPELALGQGAPGQQQLPRRFRRGGRGLPGPLILRREAPVQGQPEPQPRQLRRFPGGGVGRGGQPAFGLIQQRGSCLRVAPLQGLPGGPQCRPQPQKLALLGQRGGLSGQNVQAALPIPGQEGGPGGLQGFAAAVQQPRKRHLQRPGQMPQGAQGRLGLVMLQQGEHVPGNDIPGRLGLGQPLGLPRRRQLFSQSHGCTSLQKEPGREAAGQLSCALVRQFFTVPSAWKTGSFSR